MTREKKKPSFLGNGTYGCVFTPPLDCKNSPPINPKHVGKVFLNKHAFKEEYKSYKYMTDYVDTKSQFTVPMSTSCTVKPKTLDHIEINKCASFEGSERQIVYPNHGYDLLHYAKKHRGDPKAFFKLIKALAPIFKGLETMERAQVVHSDIKPGNMLYNPVQQRVVLIDYGLVTPFSEIYGKSHNELKHAFYMYFPPEFKLVIPKQFSNHLVQSLDNAHHGQAQTFFDAFHIDVHSELSKLSHARDKLPSLLNKIDIYSLGISIAEIMNIIIYSKDVQLTRMDKMKMLIVKNMIRHMIRINPQERANPSEIAKIYRECIMIL